MTRVLLVCQWYAPEPIHQPGWIVDALSREGLEVGVLTGIPNYPTGVVADGYRASRPVTERLNGAAVRRAPLYPSHDRSALGRLLNYATWAISASIFGLRALRWAQATLVYSSPATAALPAMMGRLLFRTPYVLLVQDVWPDSIFASGYLTGRPRRLVEGLLNVFVRASYRYAAHVAVSSPGMADLLHSRGVPRERISVIYNWVLEDPTSDGRGRALELRASLGIANSDFVVLYAGNHGPAQALHVAVEVFATYEGGRPAHLVLVGDGVEKEDLIAQARRHGGRGVHFVDAMPREQLVELMNCADAQLVSLAKRPLFAVTTPSKLQAALAAGSPVLVVGDGDVAATVSKAAAGVSVPAEDVTELRRAVRTLASLRPEELARMGTEGHRLYEEEMSARVGAGRLATLLRGAAAPGRKGKR